MGKRTSVYFDRETMQFVGIDDAMKKQLFDIYKGVDIDAQLESMRRWLMSPKGLKRQGNKGFVMKWLNNAVDKTQCIQPQSIEMDECLRPMILEYLEGLWTERQHILELNKIRKKP